MCVALCFTPFFRRQPVCLAVLRGGQNSRRSVDISREHSRHSAYTGLIMFTVRLGIDDVRMSYGAGPKRHLGWRRVRPSLYEGLGILDEAQGTERGRTSKRCLRERRRLWQRYPGYIPVIVSSGVSRQLNGTFGRVRVRPPFLLFAIICPPIGDIVCALQALSSRR